MEETGGDDKYRFFNHVSSYMQEMMCFPPDQRAEECRKYMINKITTDKKNFSRVNVTSFFMCLTLTISSIRKSLFECILRKFYLFQMWIEEYTKPKNINYFSYLATIDVEDCEIDAFVIMMSAYYLGRVITIVTPAGHWSTTSNVNHDIVLIYRGGKIFIDTELSEKYLFYIL